MCEQEVEVMKSKDAMKKIESALDLYARFIVGLGTVAVIGLGIYFVTFRHFPEIFKALNEPLLTFLMGYVFFDLLCREGAKAAKFFEKKKVKLSWH
jgi:hypothetical protein